MIGSVIGDIVGSIYEFSNVKTKDFPFFTELKEFTDDSILTIATADWLLHGGEAGHYYANYAQRYPDPMGAYGTSFAAWARSATDKCLPRPYNSCGNGSAMRVGPVGWAFDTEEDVLTAARRSAECTHNHPEGIKGAQATALCVFMALGGASKGEIRTTIETRFGYNLHFDCDDIRHTYQWSGSCQGSVPQAIVAFLDGTDFEDCIRYAVSIGGDSDTIACITGSIAEAFYGIPQAIREKGMSYLPQELLEVTKSFEGKYGKKILL